MQASPLLRAHRRVLIAKRLHDQALKSLVPGLESSYRRLSKACWRRSKFDPPCRLNFDPGLGAGIV